MTKINPFPKLLLFLLVFSSLPLFGQYTKEEKKTFESGIIFTRDRLYDEALPKWKKLIDAHPDHPGLNFYIGLCYYHHPEKKFKGIPHLEKAVDSVSSEFKPFLKNHYAPSDAHFYLGKLYHLQYEFDKAIEQFKAFEEKANERLLKEFEPGHHIEMAREAKIMVRNPIFAVIENMGPGVNSQYEDHSPLLDSAGNTLFFTSRRLRKDSSNYRIREWGTGKHFEEIYISKKDSNGEWEEARPLELFQENDASPSPMVDGMRPGYSRFNHTATSMITSKEGDLIVYRTSGNRGDLYRSKKDNGEWSAPQKIRKAINSKSFENHMAISGDERNIFFVSDREGGFGGRDIYGMTKLPNGDWSKVYNLGPRINTKYDEDGPFLHPDGKTLYFSSKGHNTMGGYDIFTSTVTDSGTWEKPHNVGYPINTPDDDVYFMVTPDGSTGYYSVEFKNVKKNVEAVDGFGEEDIYRVRFPGEMKEKVTLLKGMVKADKCVDKLEKVNITVLGKEKDTLDHLRPIAGQGEFISMLPSGGTYELVFSLDGRSLHNETLDLPARSAYQSIKRAIHLDTLKLSCDQGTFTAHKKKTDVSSALNKERRRKRDVLGLWETTTGKIVKEDTTAPCPTDTVFLTAKTETTSSKEKEKEKSGPAASDKPQDLLFKKHFDYNGKAVSLREAQWNQMIEKIAQKAEQGKVHLRVEGSASHVPTKTYPSNLILASHRAEALKKTLKKALRERNIPMENVRIEDISVNVAGPPYEKDPDKKEKYQPYQYVKVFWKD